MVPTHELAQFNDSPEQKILCADTVTLRSEVLQEDRRETVEKPLVKIGNLLEF